jgi:hypothetical protein
MQHVSALSANLCSLRVNVQGQGWGSDDHVAVDVQGGVKVQVHVHAADADAPKVPRVGSGLLQPDVQSTSRPPRVLLIRSRTCFALGPKIGRVRGNRAM